MIRVSQEKDKESGYIEFDDEDPVDWATLVGIHHIKTVVIKVSRVPQEDIRKKYKQQNPTEDPRQGTLDGRTVGTLDTSPDKKKDQPGTGLFRGPQEQERPDSGEHLTNAKSSSRINNLETQGRAPGVTKPPQSGNTPDGQGSGQGDRRNSE